MVKEVGVRLERTATQSGGGPYLANLQMVNLTVNGPTFSITTLHAGEEREVYVCVCVCVSVCVRTCGGPLEDGAAVHQEAHFLKSQ